MKTYSKGWVWRRLIRIKNNLGVSWEELTQILDVDWKNLGQLMRDTSGRVSGEAIPLAQMDELDKLIKLSRIAFDKKKSLKIWIRDKSIPIYGGSAPIDYLKQGDYEMVRYSLAIINSDSCA